MPYPANRIIPLLRGEGASPSDGRARRGALVRGRPGGAQRAAEHATRGPPGGPAGRGVPNIFNPARCARTDTQSRRARDCSGTGGAGGATAPRKQTIKAPPTAVRSTHLVFQRAARRCRCALDVTPGGYSHSRTLDIGDCFGSPCSAPSSSRCRVSVFSTRRLCQSSSRVPPAPQRTRRRSAGRARPPLATRPKGKRALPEHLPRCGPS